jgi:hypothetical protein
MIGTLMIVENRSPEAIGGGGLSRSWDFTGTDELSVSASVP